jgi:hypothetical protein
MSKTRIAPTVVVLESSRQVSYQVWQLTPCLPLFRDKLT